MVLQGSFFIFLHHGYRLFGLSEFLIQSLDVLVLAFFQQMPLSRLLFDLTVQVLLNLLELGNAGLQRRNSIIALLHLVFEHRLLTLNLLFEALLLLDVLLLHGVDLIRLLPHRQK